MTDKQNHIECAECMYARPDKIASEKGWTAYECGNVDSEYYKSLLNVSSEGDKQRIISWGGCELGNQGDLMSAVEFLEKAYRIEERMNSILEQMQQLRAIAAKTTQTLSDMPFSGTREIHPLEKCIAAIDELEREQRDKLAELANTKLTISNAINSISDIDCQLYLEYRYMSHKSTAEIMNLLFKSKRSVERLHKRALKEIQTLIQSWRTLP